MIKQAQVVLDFWFGTLENKYHIPEEKTDMWFRNGSAYDEIIRAEFLEVHKKACNEELPEWLNFPKSILALILLLDQFSRHLYRNQAKAFAQDEQCLRLVQKGIREGFDRDLYLVERQFFYMPLMHAEDIHLQKLSIKMFSNLLNDAPMKLKQSFKSTLSFAESHHHVITQFGRFPELNKILGRENTTEEIAFLNTGKYRFL